MPIEQNPSVLWYYDTEGEDGPEELNYISFTATTEENHSGKATVSKYPVQKGFEVSHHMIRHNRHVNVRAYIPEIMLGGIDADGAEAGAKIAALAGKFGVPLGGMTVLAGGIVADPLGVASNYMSGVISSVAPTVRGIAGAADSALGVFGVDLGVNEFLDDYLPNSSRIKDMFDRIQRIQERGILCALSTLNKQYSDMVLIDYQIPTTLETNTTMFIDLVFEEVLVVDSSGARVTTISSSSLSEADKEAATKRAENLHDSGIETFVKDVAGQAKDYMGGLFA